MSSGNPPKKVRPNPGGGAASDPRAALPSLLGRLDASGSAPLEKHLRAHSHLPGPRGNLELAAAFAEAVADRLNRDPDSAGALWTLCQSWCALDPEREPENSPGVFLVFCGTLALSAFAVDRVRLPRIGPLLRERAADPRWRVREAVAMALQRLLGGSRAAVSTARRELRAWSRAKGEWLLMRAVVAAVAEPVLLRQESEIGAAFALHEAVLDQVRRSGDRDAPEFRTLRQALGYSISVLAAAAPERGMELLEKLAARDDPDLHWIVRKNLKKKRLATASPQRAKSLAKKMGVRPSAR